MATLTVGTNGQYSTIEAAVAASNSGDTIDVTAGTYTDDFVTITHDLTVQAVGGPVTLVATQSPPNGKAIIDEGGSGVSVTLDGLSLTGAKVADNNGAGVRYEGGSLVMNNCIVYGNQDGILGAPDPNGAITIENSEFSGNGGEDGFTHNIYIGDIKSFTLLNSYIHDAAGGHEVKSRAQNNLISGNRIYDNNADGSYSIDLPNGGSDVVQDNTIEKGVNTPNYTTVHFGGEGTPYAGSSLLVSGNTVVNDNPNGIFINNQSGLSTVTATGNQLWNYNSPNGGAVTATGNTVLSARPALDMSTVAPTVAPLPPPPTVTDVPAGSTLQAWGPGGAVTASGHVLTVGAGQQFTTLAAALAASKDGDTIDVLAGNYVDDFGTVNHKVVIQGVGGIAHFSESAGIYGPTCLLQVNTDATLANLSFSDVHDYNGHAGGIEVAGGNVTINNCQFSGNDQAILVDGNPAANLAIYGSQFDGNGNDAKGTNNLTVGAINSFTLKNSVVEGAPDAHELASYAYNSDIENNRIFDGTAPASFSIDLGQGGNAVVKDNVLEKGVNAQNGIFILSGGEGAPYSNSNVEITGNTFISDMVNPGHPYTYFIVAGNKGVVPTDVDGNTFVGGVPGSADYQNAAEASGNAAAASASVDTTTPVCSAALAPAAPAAATGPDTLTVLLTDRTPQLGANFTVAVDGTVIGGGVVTAGDGQAPAQAFTFTGNWGAGSHAVTVTQLFPPREWWLPAASDLYVNGVTLDGTASTARTDLNAWSPSATVTLAVPAPAQAQAVVPAPDFDAAWYLAHNPDVAASGMDPLLHYEEFGWKEGRNPDAFFDTSYYLKQNPDVAASGMDPLLHFEQYGWKEGRGPSLLFSDSKYLAAYRDVAHAGMDPLQHYLQYGQAEGRMAFVPGPMQAADPLVSASYYDSQLGATLVPANTAAAAEQAAASYNAVGWQQGLNPDAWFNTAYYLAQNPDVAAAHVNPLLHYETYGWKEGRDPSASFDTNLYLQHNPDVAAAGVDPLVQYVTAGAAQGRVAYAVPGS